MEQTQEQKEASQNPTPVTFNVPTEGLFIGGSSGGKDLGTIYKMSADGSSAQAWEITQILTPEQKAGKNYGQQIELATNILKTQYGFDVASLPMQNLADLNSSGYLQPLATKLYQANPTPENSARIDSMFAGGFPLKQTGGSFLDFTGGTQVAGSTSVTANTQQQSLANGQTAIPPAVNLEPGSTNTTEVKKLQDYLVSKGYMTQAEVDTGYGTYGPKTTAAVKKLQEDLGVDNSTGPGYWGPRTMAAVNSQVGTTNAGTTSGTTSPTTTSTTGTPTTGTTTTSPTTTSTTGTGIVAGVDYTALDTALAGFNLTDDQKAIINSYYGAVINNDQATADKITAAIEFGTQFSDPVFKAQSRLVVDALDRAFKAQEGDLAYNENKLRTSLDKLKEDVSSSKEYLSFQQQQELKSLEQRQQQDLETLQENMAATGFTSSTRRVRKEEILGETYGGLIESSNRAFQEKQEQLSTQLARGETDTATELARLNELAKSGQLDLLRQYEETLGSEKLAELGYSNLLGNIPSTLEAQQQASVLNFASGSSLVF